MTVDAPRQRAATRAVARSSLRTAQRRQNAANRQRQASAPATQPVVARESAYGPVDGYNATRSGTGTKTDTPIRDIPQSIQVVPREVIVDQGGTQVGDALRNVSGVVSDGNAGGRNQAFNIRGFSTSQTATDGLLNNRYFGTVGVRDLLNVERVEVLKGPASVLYGQATPGGLVNFVTKQPTAVPFFLGDVSGGSYGTFRSAFDASGPISTDKSVTARLNFAYERTDSFRDYFIPSERATIAPVVKWQVTPDTTVVADLYHTDQRRQFDRGFVPIGNALPNLPIGRYLGDRFLHTDAATTEGRLRVEHNFDSQWTMRAAVRGGVADAFTAGNSGSVAADNRTFEQGGFEVKDTLKDATAQAELIGRFATGAINHTVLFGTETSQSSRGNRVAFFDIPSIDIYAPIYTGVRGPSTPSTLYTSGLKTASAYAQDQIDLPAGFKLLVGGRFDDARQTDTSPGSVEKVNNSAVTPRFGIVWQPTDTVALYTSYARSFIPQSGLSMTGGGFDPERGVQVEAGVKLDSPNKLLSATLATFQIKKQNVLTTDTTDPNFSVAVGEQTSRGVEVDVTGQLAPGWRMIASGAYIDARVSKDNDIAIGNRLSGIPFLSGSFWSTYEVQSGPLAGLGFGGGLFAVGKRQGDIENTFTVPGYVRLDAVIWYPVAKDVRAQINVANALDHKYIDASTNRFNVVPGQPLTVTGRLTFRF